RAFGKFVEILNGRFLTGEDVGTSSDDMRIVGQETKYAIYPPKSYEAEHQAFFLTAFGVLRGIQASVKEMYGNDSLSGIRVAIQGVGKVGDQLARLLHAEGAKLTLTDLNDSRLRAISKELGTEFVKPHEIYQVDTEVFSPCALGGILNNEVVPHIRCKIVAGAANNQLADEWYAEELWKRGILYAPDYVINAGGLISALYEMGICDKATVIRMTSEIYDRLRTIFHLASSEKIPTQVVANRMVEERIFQAKKCKTK
ncbi:MAG: leucine dehydrogenase, partial [ANME-2 cluster archaeon]